MSSHTLLLRFDTLPFFHSHVSLLFSHCHGRNFILRLAWSRFPRKSVRSDHDNLLTGVVRHVDAFMLVAWLLLSFSFLFLSSFLSFPFCWSPYRFIVLTCAMWNAKKTCIRTCASGGDTEKKSIRARARYVTHISLRYGWLR